MKDGYSSEILQGGSGIHTDRAPIDQPKGTHRFALNAVNEATDGQQAQLSNEKSNYECTTRPAGYEEIGDKYIGDDENVLLLVNPSNNRFEIGVLTKDNLYATIVNTAVVPTKITNQCDVTFRLRRGSEKVIYWVDATGLPKTFNLNRIHNFYSPTFKTYLKGGGDPNTFVGEKWDGSSFNLIKTYSSVPFFSNISLVEGGGILPGSYNFAIQYVDEDLNPTEWVSTSNTVNIFNDNITNTYQRIRGSRNVDTSSQSFPRANKSVKLTITNLDTSFPFYRVAIIRAASNTGQPDKVLASDLYSTSDSNFQYTGNDANLTEVAIEDILIDKEVIYSPKHIEQLENRLILAGTKGKSINWCEFQPFASKIASTLTTKAVVLNNVLSEPNIKNAKSTFFFRGYMPGEVYSFGIVYLFSDGFMSPVFHIPGKSSTNMTSTMKVYELTNDYLDIHNCSTNDYWALDSEGHTLVNKKVRHHRFPFRKDVNKPLVTISSATSIVNKYRLTINITLNPAWTPGPNTYPTSGGNPVSIPYSIQYQITGAGSPSSFNGVLVDTDIGVDIIIYDDVTDIDQINPPDYGQLDTTSDLATIYNPPPNTNDRFIITFTRLAYVASTSVDDDNSEIFGIKFSNIQKPHPDVVGFYIVRNERTDDDRMILDNAIFGAMTEFQQYKSFGLLMPKQFYTANNCGTSGDSGKTLSYYKRGIWFFNPEFEFFNKKTEFNSIEVEGTYAESEVDMPTISDVAGSACNSGKSKGIYINDVQAGTSYDPNVNKKKSKDDDGFDLIVGYRNTKVTYAINNTLVFPTKKQVIYLNATAYQNASPDTFYNVSVDNKIGMYLTNTDVDTDDFNDPGTNENALIYGSLVRSSTTLYSNFMTRSYYKEHNNPILFGGSTTLNNIEIFNGDAQISALNMVSSIFYDMVVADRPKKNKLWKIVVGALLVVAAVVVSVVTLGAGTPAAVAVAAGALGSLAISYGVSLAMSGIKFEQFKSMIDVDYEKGLKDTVVDGGVFETIRDTIEREDDTIRWFSDRVSNLYIESTVAFGLRAGLTCGVSDFVGSPGPYDEQEFRSYLTEKLTVVDRDQGSGRMYKGYATAELYDMNLDYMRFNKQKVFSHLPVEYDCCSDSNEDFPMRVWYSEQSFQEEKVDNFRVFLPNNFRDIEGEHGAITDLYRLGNALFIHTKEGLWQLPQNNQERITNEIVSFIGTGEFFSIMPRKVIDDTLGSGGTQHKWATVKTRSGVMFVNEIENKIYLHGETIKDVTEGNRDWFENNLRPFLSKQLFDKFGIDFLNDNNPANPNGIGYLSAFDTRYNRILLTKKDYLILPSKLALLTKVDTIPVGGTAFAYCTLNGIFYQGIVPVPFTNDLYFENKSWTISYSFHSNSFVSYHSYLPNYYIHSQNDLYSIVAGNNKIWKHHLEGSFQTFYGIYRPYIIEYIKPLISVQTDILEDIILYTKARRWDVNLREYNDENSITFNKIIVYNSNQSSGEQIMIVKNTQAAPQNWLQHQIVNVAGSILITKKERNWNINDLRDYVTDYDKPLFTTAWIDIKADYPIDKKPNTTIISFAKPWNELQNFRDKYIVIRIKFDNFSDVNLITKLIVETEQSSNR